MRKKTIGLQLLASNEVSEIVTSFKAVVQWPQSAKYFQHFTVAAILDFVFKAFLRQEKS